MLGPRLALLFMIIVIPGGLLFALALAFRARGRALPALDFDIDRRRVPVVPRREPLRW